jgi:hypothetical protein
MRGLWKAALLAPALVSADWMINDLQDQGEAPLAMAFSLPRYPEHLRIPLILTLISVVTLTTIDVPIPRVSESPDVSTVLV